MIFFFIICPLSLQLIDCFSSLVLFSYYFHLYKLLRTNVHYEEVKHKSCAVHCNVCNSGHTQQFKIGLTV